ncbi:MAG: tetratricopeptide repeat-containing protein kinase family protein [Pirellulaceae bacterium]
MSPEQTRFDHSGIDTRTDIYALGAVLYELVTGVRPFGEYHLNAKPLDEALAIIRNSEPLRASRRPIQEALCQRTIPPELDWILQKCLEREPSRRYESVSGLIDDCRRYLNNEAVLAMPPSGMYRLKKFLRKYRAAVAATAAILLTLIAGLIGTGISLNMAIDARRLADERANDLSSALLDVEQAEAEATARAADLEVVANFQADLLSAINPYTMGTHLREQLAKGSQLASDSINSNQVQPAGNQSSESARTVIARESNAKSPATTVNLSDINFSEVALSSLDENIFAPAEATIKEKFSDQPVIQAQLLHTLAATLLKVGLTEKAELVERSAIELCEQYIGFDDLRTISAIRYRAEMLVTLGKLDEAQKISDQALSLALQHLPAGDDTRLLCMQTRSSVHSTLGQIPKSKTLLEKAIAEAESAPNADPRLTATLQHFLGKALRELGEFELAETVFRSVLEQRKKLPNEERVGVADTLGELGAVLESTRQFEEADDCLAECYRVHAEVLGRNHPVVLTALNNLAFFKFSKQNPAEAEPLVLESIARHTEALGPLHTNTLGVINTYGSYLYHSAEYAKAVEVFEELIPKLERSAGVDHPLTIAAIANLGVNYRQNNQYELALECLEKAWKKHPTHSDLDYIRHQYFSTCMSGGKPERAKQLARDEEEYLRNTYPADTLQLANQLVVPWSWYMGMSDWSAAEPLLRECVAIRERLAPNDWRTFDQQSTLGECLLKLGKYDEAEPILLAATQKMQSAPDIPVPMRDKVGYSIDRLVELYNVTNNKSQAAQWQAKLDAFSATP